MMGKIYNSALERVVLPLGDRIEGGAFVSRLNQYRREQWLPAPELERLQRERLKRMLEFARNNVSFYKAMPPPVADPFEDIKRFPVMHKRDINENVEQILTQPKEMLIAESGSGSSGIQGTVYMDAAAQASQRAMQMLWFEWSGYRMGDSILQTGMTMNRGFVKGIKDYLLNTAYISAFNLDASAVEVVLRDLEKSPRTYLFGYASSLYVLAETALELDISDIKFARAVSWGDKLFPHFREKIRRAFGCETLDTYGCTEGAMVAAECSNGKYHLSTNQNYIEVVDDQGQPVPRGQMGKVLATRLDNFAMPLIRYYLGDLVELETPDCPLCACGRETPLLRRVIGRDTDIVRTRGGKQMIVHFFTAIFEHVPEIQQFKVVQKNLDGIEIQYIPAENFTATVLPAVESKICAHLGENFPVRWVETEHIEPTGSGKPQIIQSFLKQSVGV